MSTPLQHDPDLTAFVEQTARELSTPGVGVGVLVDGRAFVAAVGVTSVANPLPVDQDTLFMIGSTSKTFTATALMALVDHGALTLKDRVIDHLPAFRLQDEEVAATVTVGHLLNHTSGWRGDLPPERGWGDDALERALDGVASAPQELPPGELASYSNSGFLLAGHLLATLRGTSFEQAVHELVLEPLGLTQTCYFPWEVAHRRHAVGHLLQDGTATPLPVFPVGRSTGPAGGLWSSVRDQLAYARYHLDGTTIESAPLLEETRLLMQQPTVTARSTIDGIGLSWLLGHHGDVRLVSHGGNISNLQTSTFVLAPDCGFAVTVMTNTKHGAAIGAKVQGWALERYLGVGPKPALPAVPFHAEDLVGSYDLGPFAWSLTTSDDRLFAEMTLPADASAEVQIAFTNPAKELVAVGPDVYALAADPVEPVLDVRRAADGSIAGIVHGMRFARRVR
jgi:CubicO group peptidase (beta-lactamase class C family)